MAGREFAWQADLTGSRAIVMGGEGEGLRELTRKSCDYLVRLPQAGAVESLNVSVATGMLLYEAMRQRIARA
jgi:23S rRNA (guanosine2251-2'-O)-methyltransferase